MSDGSPEPATRPLRIDPARPRPPRRLLRGSEQLQPLVGQRLLVGITYLGLDGRIAAARQFCGRVLDVGDGVVVVERPGQDEPAILPADAAAYRPAHSGRYRLAGTGEIVVDPDFVSTWQVATDPSPRPATPSTGIARHT